jgi:uncharacterized protein (DUF2236 family)
VGDPAAAACLDALGADARSAAVQQAMKSLVENDAQLPADLPAPFTAFLAEARELGPLDEERLQRAAVIYGAHAMTGGACLLLSAIPQGYCAPNLSQPLHATGLLDREPYRRLLAVLQMVLDVMTPGGFGPKGTARMLGARLRLLHEGIRRIIPRKIPSYEARFGVPVCVEDMLATLMGFSFLVIDGLQRLDVGLSDADAEDLWYLWRTFGRAMGIPEDALPVDVADARAFFTRYAERYFVAADVNSEGVALAKENLEMVRELIPRPLRWLGLSRLPEAFMLELLGVERSAMLDVYPLPHSARLRDRVTQGLAHLFETHGFATPFGLRLHAAFARMVFRKLIDNEYGGRPAVIIPAHVRDLWQI